MAPHPLAAHGAWQALAGPPLGPLLAATCPPARIDAAPLPAGMMRVTVASPCRKLEKVRLVYAGIEWVRALDDAGLLSTEIDCVVGDDFPVDVVFADGSRTQLKAQALDLTRVTKIAVLWRAPVNLDLHAFEYAARPDQPGHVWAGAPSSAAQAEARTTQTQRGRGFMTSVSTGAETGAKLEVYTFWRAPEQKTGVISLALDYESRARLPQDPDTCGNGLYSEIRYETIQFDRNIAVKRQFGSLASVACHVQLDGMARYNTKTAPEITVKP